MKRIFLSVGAVVPFVFLLVGCGPSGTHFREVKSAVFNGTEKLNKNIELSLGVVPIWLLGTVAGFVDQPEVREACDYIDHISRLDVGVYEIQDSFKNRFSEISRRVNVSMLKHGFQPLVQVREVNQCVGVYLPTVGDKFPREVFVVVMEHKQIVLVRMRGDFEKLAFAALKNHPLDLQGLDKAFKKEAYREAVCRIFLRRYRSCNDTVFLT
jgi:hypothetical protein